MIPEDRLKAAVVKAALGDTTLLLEIDKLLGKPWDDELETFRHAGEGAPVRWLHQVRRGSRRLSARRIRKKPGLTQPTCWS